MLFGVEALLGDVNREEERDRPFVHDMGVARARLLAVAGQCSTRQEKHLDHAVSDLQHEGVTEAAQFCVH
jgi:hypothetical protein